MFDWRSVREAAFVVACVVLAALAGWWAVRLAFWLVSGW